MPVFTPSKNIIDESSAWENAGDVTCGLGIKPHESLYFSWRHIFILFSMPHHFVLCCCWICVVNIIHTIEKALKAIMLCAFLCVYRTWRGTHLAAMTYCSLASETAPMHHVAQKVDRWQRLTDENNLNVKTLKVIFHKATYLSLSNVKDQFYKSSSAKDTSNCTFYCSKRTFIFFYLIRYLCSKII